MDRSPPAASAAHRAPLSPGIGHRAVPRPQRIGSRVRRVAGLALFALAGGVLPAAAQDTWPTRPIRFILPQAAGSAPDITARRLGDRLSRRLGQPIVVDNRAGAGGAIAAEAVAQAAPDGHTFFLATSAPLVLNAFLARNQRYDPARDFTGVARVSASPFVLVAGRNTPFDTLAELIAQEKARPGSFSFASDGKNSAAGLAGEMFNTRAGTRLLHVPYNSTMRAVQDTIGGQTQLSFQSSGLVLEGLRNGDLKALALTTERVPLLFPGVPSIAETVPGFNVTGYTVMVAPRATPRPIVERMNAEVDAILHEPDWMQEQDRANGGLIRSAGTPAQLDEFLTAERVRWGALIRQLGLQPD